MKTILTPIHCLFFAACLFFCSLSTYGKTECTPSHYVVICSPNLPAAFREDLFKEFSYFALGGTGKANEAEFGMKPTDTLQVYDGSTMRSLLSRTFVMPPDADSPKKRAKASEELRATFTKFLKSQPDSEGPIDIPKLASSYKQMIEYPDSKVLLIGSPLYHDDVDAHDMRDGWLSDGYFLQPLSVTTFSIAGRETALRGNPIVFCTVNDDIYGTENKNAHMEGVKRFWALFISQCGGKLVGYQPDIKVAFSTLAKNDLPEIGPFKVDPEDKSMRVIKTKNTKIQETKLAPPVSVIASQRQTVPQETQSETAPDITTSEYSWMTKAPADWNSENKGKATNKNTKLSLSWDTSTDSCKDADLDIYVRPKDSPNELYYKNNKTPQGVHYKDFSNQNASHGFELVDMNSSINAENLEIWVNAYGGTSKNGFSGEVRILNGGLLTAYPFTIPIKQGDQGLSANKRAQSKNWVRIVTGNNVAESTSVPSPTPIVNGGEYTFVKGDNLYMVAEKFGVKFSDLVEINKIKDPRDLKVGQRITIPKQSRN